MNLNVELCSSQKELHRKYCKDMSREKTLTEIAKIQETFGKKKKSFTEVITLKLQQKMKNSPK